MMQHGSDKTLEDRLNMFGKSLLKPPSSHEELLKLLNKIEKNLVCVEQSPSTSMQASLSTLMKAIVTDELLNNSNDDIKVGVASCICEITRITAPDAPYDDEKMKAVFQLIITSMENLSDLPSRSLQRKANILETVAKVRSCVMLLDLECDQMILEMFNNFFKAIRPYHKEIIFASMEAIMTLVLEESEEISADLINLILSTLRRDNEVNPLAKNLAERVIQNSSDKLRPYLAEAVKSLNSSLEDYCEAVALICRENNSAVEHSSESILKFQTQEDGNAESIRQHKNPTTVRAPKSAVSNGSNDICSELTTHVAISSKTNSNHLADAKSAHKSEINKLDPEGPGKPSTHIRCVEAEKPLDNQEIPTDSVHVCPSGVKTSEEGNSIAVVKDAITSSPSQAPENKAAGATSPTQCSIADESHSDRGGSPVERQSSAMKPIFDDTMCQMVFEEDNLSETKQRPHGRKIDEVSNKHKGSANEGAHKRDGGSASNSEAISVDQKIVTNCNKVEDGRENGDGTTSGAESESVVQKRKRGRPRLDRSKLSTGEDHVKEMSSPLELSKLKRDEVVLERTPRMKSKGKQTVETKGSESKECRENLIGLKIKVWWPKDQMFYEGVVASFDSATKRHKVLYTDGDMEILNLQKQKWKHFTDEMVSDEDKDVEHLNHNAPDMRTKRKINSNLDTPNKPRKSEDSPKIEDKDTPMPESKSGKKASHDAAKSEDGCEKQGGKLHGGSANASSRSNDDSIRSASHQKQGNEGNMKSHGGSRKRSKAAGSIGKMTNPSSPKVKGSDDRKGKPDLEKIKTENIDTFAPETKSSKKRIR